MQNQNPEQISHDLIDNHLAACGWSVQSKKKINLGESLGVAVEFLRRLGIFEAETLKQFSPLPILNRRGDTVGRVEASFNL